MVQRVRTSSRDQGNTGTLQGVFDEVLRKKLQVTDDTLPAIVESYNATDNIVTVRPAIRMLDITGAEVRREPIFVPAMKIGASVRIHFQLKAGDLGWIKASDRDISNFLNGYAEAAPASRRLHTFSDAMFIPDFMRGFDFAQNLDMVITNADGTVRIELFEDRIDITAPDININTSSDTTITATGDVNINATGDAKVTATNATIDAATALTGGTEAAAAIGRVGDAVQVSIPANTFLVTAQNGMANAAPVTVSGTITAGSPRHTST